MFQKSPQTVREKRQKIHPPQRICSSTGAHRYKSAIADLYHIELERSESISNLPQGKYIELSAAKHIDKTGGVSPPAIHKQKEQEQKVLSFYSCSCFLFYRKSRKGFISTRDTPPRVSRYSCSLCFSVDMWASPTRYVLAALELDILSLRANSI